MLGALLYNLLLMPVALTLLDYQYARSLYLDRNGNREERNKERYEILVNRVEITMEFGTKIKTLSTSSVDTAACIKT
jgi:hypothetical protein